MTAFQNNLSGVLEAMEAKIPTAFAHIAGAATTVLKSGPGRLFRIIYNKAVALSVVTTYDNVAASGTIIAVITMPAVLLDSQRSVEYDVPFANGLTIVTSAADDITVVYQ